MAKSKVNRAMAAIQSVALAATVDDQSAAQEKLEGVLKEMSDEEKQELSGPEDPTAEEWMEFGRKVVSAVRMGMKIYKAFAP